MKKLFGFTWKDVLYMLFLSMLVTAIAIWSMTYNMGVIIDMYLYKFFTWLGF
jgi:hypothetical protein